MSNTVSVTVEVPAKNIDVHVIDGVPYVKLEDLNVDANQPVGIPFTESKQQVFNIFGLTPVELAGLVIDGQKYRDNA